MSITIWSVPNGLHLANNLKRVHEALREFHPQRADLFNFPCDVPESLTAEDTLCFEWDSDHVPVIHALQLVGMWLKDARVGARKEVAWRLSREYCRNPPPVRDQVANTLGACYECLIYLAIEHIGFPGFFVRGSGRPDLCFPNQRLLVECKDCQVDWAQAADIQAVEAQLRDKIKKGNSQLSDFLGNEDATRVMFVDLPDNASSMIEALTQEELEALLMNVVYGVERPARIWFTHFPVHQHLGEDIPSSLTFPTPRFMETRYVVGIDLPIADLQNRIRYWIRGDSFPHPPPFYDPPLAVPSMKSTT